MTRDAYVRMDVDTRLVYNQRMRRLQRAFPDEWPIFGMAYIALLGEAWHGRSRDVRLEDAWPAALRCDYERCRDALRDVGLIDRFERIPRDAWEDWYGPAAKRIIAGRNAAASRWQREGSTQTARQTAHQTDRKSRKRGGETNGGAPVHMKDAMAAAGFDPDKLRGD